jgi:hypothetical protein
MNNMFHSSTVSIRIEYQLGAAYVTFIMFPFLMFFFYFKYNHRDTLHPVSHFAI